MPRLLWGAGSLAAAAAPSDWLWQGYLAPGAVTLLTGQWKAGKTTLASILLARMRAGGQLAGLPLSAGKAVVVSEEGPDHWQRRHQALDFGDHIGWCCNSFRGKPRLAEWSAFVDGLADLHARLTFALLVIDPLAAFLPGCENHAGSVLEARMPLQRLNLLSEGDLYRYEDSREGAESPLDRWNHALDALRYLIYGLDAHHLAGRRPGPAEDPAAKPPPKPKPWFRLDNEALWTHIGPE